MSADCWLVAAGPNLHTLTVQRFTDAASAALRFFELNQSMVGAVRVLRIAEGKARLVGRAEHGVGAASVC